MDRTYLRQKLIDHFSEVELRELCFDLAVEYDDLPGRSRRENAMELIVFLDRRGRLAELIALCRQLRPNVEWPEIEPGSSMDAGSASQEGSAMANPFTFGNPITEPDRFFGRRREVEQVFSRLRNPEHESSSIVGGRRVGKTSLLKYLAHPDVRRRFDLDPERYIFIYVDLQLLDQSTDPQRLWKRLLGQMDRHCRNAEVKILLKELRQAEFIDNFILADLFDVVDEQDQHIVFLLDEFENVTENVNFDTSFFYGLRALAIQSNLSMVTSSHHELIELTHSEAIRSSPFFNIFANFYLGLLSAADARQLIASNLSGSDVSFSDEEIETVFRIAGTYPFFLQAACAALFAAYQQNLDADNRIAYLQEAFKHQAVPHLDHYWQDSDSSEQIVLLILALLDQQSGLEQGSFDRELINQLYTRSEQALARLVNRALVKEVDGGLALFGSVFGEWIASILTAANRDVMESQVGRQAGLQTFHRLPGSTKRAIEPILSLVAGTYHPLIINWAAQTADAKAMARLLEQTLISAAQDGS